MGMKTHKNRQKANNDTEHFSTSTPNSFFIVYLSRTCMFFVVSNSRTRQILNTKNFFCDSWRFWFKESTHNFFSLKSVLWWYTQGWMEFSFFLYHDKLISHRSSFEFENKKCKQWRFSVAGERFNVHCRQMP